MKLSILKDQIRRGRCKKSCVLLEILFLNFFSSISGKKSKILRIRLQNVTNIFAYIFRIFFFSRNNTILVADPNYGQVRFFRLPKDIIE